MHVRAKNCRGNKGNNCTPLRIHFRAAPGSAQAFVSRTSPRVIPLPDFISTSNSFSVCHTLREQLERLMALCSPMAPISVLCVHWWNVLRKFKMTEAYKRFIAMSEYKIRLTGIICNLNLKKIWFEFDLLFFLAYVDVMRRLLRKCQSKLGSKKYLYFFYFIKTYLLSQILTYSRTFFFITSHFMLKLSSAYSQFMPLWLLDKVKCYSVSHTELTLALKSFHTKKAAFIHLMDAKEQTLHCASAGQKKPKHAVSCVVKAKDFSVKGTKKKPSYWARFWRTKKKRRQFCKS